MKKMLTLVLAGLMILSLAACGGAGGEKLSMVIDAKTGVEGEKYSADVFYSPSETVTAESSYENRQKIENLDEDICIELRLCADTTYTNNKNSSAGEDNYVEQKIGNFDAYGYSYSQKYYHFYIHLDGNAEGSGEKNCYIEAKISPVDKSADVDAKDLAGSKFVQNVLKSVVFNGIVVPGEEAAAE